MMEVVAYIVRALAITVRELLANFGPIFALALVLWFVSQGIRGYGSGLLGNGYYWLVAPGVICHETGHALGCLLTRTRIIRFVPFHPQGDTLGYVEHEVRPGIWHRMALFVIATGPIWLGCAMILLLSRWVAGPDFLPAFREMVPQPGASSLAYLRAIWRGATGMLWMVLDSANWRSARFVVSLFLIFCIASEITLSPPDLRSMWRGALAIAFVLLLANLVPFTARYLATGIDKARVWVFVAESVLLFVLLADLIFLVIVRLLWGIFRPRWG